MKKRVVRAEEFEVVDESGDVRLRIGLGNDDSAGLAIGDDNGKVCARLGLAGDGSPFIRFMDEQKAPTWTMR